MVKAEYCAFVKSTTVGSFVESLSVFPAKSGVSTVSSPASETSVVGAPLGSNPSAVAEFSTPPASTSLCKMV